MEVNLLTLAGYYGFIAIEGSPFKYNNRNLQGQSCLKAATQILRSKAQGIKRHDSGIARLHTTSLLQRKGAPLIHASGVADFSI